MVIPSFVDIYRQIDRNFRLVGIKFDNSGHDVWFFLLYIVLMFVIIEEMAFFVSKISSENFLELAQLAPCVVTGILSVAKILCIYLNKSKVFLLINNLKNLYNTIKDPVKADYIKDDVIMVQRLTKYYFILNLVLLTIYNFSTLITMGYELVNGDEIKFRLPYSILTPIAINSFINWIVVYLHLIISGYVCGVYFSTVDAFYCFSASQLGIHFSLLSKELENLVSNNDRALNEIIKKHQYIIKLSADFEEIYTLTNLLNVLCGSIVICALCFNITTGSLVQIPGFLVFLASVLLQILMMSIFGDNLITQSLGVGGASYLCQWYKMDLSTRKTIMIIRERANKPQKLTAYKFSTICNRSFTKIIRVSWSYFTILKTLYKPNE